MQNYNDSFKDEPHMQWMPHQDGLITDYGPNPFTVDIRKAAYHNNTYRTALWTGAHLQLTMMDIEPGDDIGLEIHPYTDQFLYIVDGQGLTLMGDTKEFLWFRQPVYDDCAIFIPANTWHNVVNTGKRPLKLISVYAPPHHPFGTVHETKIDAIEE
ncbi:MAG: cupin domain-containing protein [Defluviitaleaceae bacterium]|nr:cupin domain-containing protein [Defluviitaleaceae bacterium]